MDAHPNIHPNFYGDPNPMIKKIVNTFFQFVLEALDNIGIVFASLAIYLMMAFGFDQSEVVLARNPGALLAVLAFVGVWTLTIVITGTLVQALKTLKKTESGTEVQK